MIPVPHRIASLALAIAAPLALAAESCSAVNSPEAQCLEREHEAGRTWQQAREACPIEE